MQGGAAEKEKSWNGGTADIRCQGTWAYGIINPEPDGNVSASDEPEAGQGQLGTQDRIIQAYLDIIS